ncbi:MAG TPA: preprotein translocase subunit SecY [Caldisericia bacterium]|nr:preprotein translocase subunit SecY [Caldisericia bacterium]HPF49299.1 preprotein translocase subunit SecY [Caldisericia bacterium]HPI84021.1 preprotein translocase subunit SecY [Caldisericia bacterium]HPQ93279.1 preprotein translocase subunit SecY [Caldisericia bacterium]HRV75339.1 preprotein translocase subunit SecY [Caldisericia bacterium]
MWKTIRNAWNIPELRSRIGVTLGLFMLFRLGNHITLPGINRVALYAMSQQGGFLGLLNMFSGGGLLNISLFSLGVIPYINASIILNLLQTVIPALDKMVREGGMEGRRKMAQITKWVTVGLASLQAFSFAFILYPNILKSVGMGQVDLYVVDSLSLKLFAAFLLIAGSFLLVWLGEVMTEKGIGNGVSLIIFAGIIARLIPGFASITENIRGGALDIITFVLFIAIFILFIGLVIWAYEAERRVPVQHAKRIVGRRMYGGQTTYIPLRLIQAGVLPIIFASAVITFPQVIGSFLSQGSWWNTVVVANLSSTTSWVYNVAFFLLVVFFTYFYTSMQYDPERLSEDLQKQGGFVPGVRPGDATKKYFQDVLAKVTLPASIFLGALAVLPNIFLKNQPTFSSMFIGGTGILITIGVALETVNQIESYLTMRNYEGFLGK